MTKIYILLLLYLLAEGNPLFAFAFAPTKPLVKSLSPVTKCSSPITRRQSQPFPTRLYSAKTFKNSSSIQNQPKAKPREGVGSWLLNLALRSPLWELVLVPQARASMIKTAEANGINWVDAYDWIATQPTGPWMSDNDNSMGGARTNTGRDVVLQPEYYRKKFHAYEQGNLCWEAAFEQEIASRAVGARNFPTYGSKGEDGFRGAFDSALGQMGAQVPEKDGVILDMGCGTGTSSRRLASKFSQVSQVLGMDLSPYFIQVGKTLLSLAPKGQDSGGPWVTSIQPDDRIDLRVGDIVHTKLTDESVDVVNLSLVIHELPLSVSKEVIDEAFRILRPGGQIWISEMDFDAPAYAAQRENSMLFSLIRATEPYLDVYADGCGSIRNHLAERFHVRITAATGRHYALVATKGASNGLEDYRFNVDGQYIIEDTHLKPWESQKE